MNYFIFLECTKLFHNICNDLLTFPAFQLRSLGIRPSGDNRTITAAVTLVTASGGEPNDFSSVKFALKI
jgi:hypothetical protein